MQDEYFDQTKSSYEMLLFLKTSKAYTIRFEFDSAWKRVDGNWDLEISTIDDRTLYQKSFNVVAK